VTANLLLSAYAVPPSPPCSGAHIQAPLAEMPTEPQTQCQIQHQHGAFQAKRRPLGWLRGEELLLLQKLQKGSWGHPLSCTCQSTATDCTGSDTIVFTASEAT